MVLKNKNRDAYQYHKEEEIEITSSSTVSPGQLDSKIDIITKDLNKAWFRNLRNGISVENADTICSYIIDMKADINPTTNYIVNSIKLPYLFSRYLNNKPFKNVTRQDIIDFLDSRRKSEALDPMHKWIGTRNLYLVHLIRFFKWLYYPDIEYRKRLKPAVVGNSFFLSFLFRDSSNSFCSSPICWLII